MIDLKSIPKNATIVSYSLDFLFNLELKGLEKITSEELDTLFKKYIVDITYTYLGKEKNKYLLSYIPFGEFHRITQAVSKKIFIHILKCSDKKYFIKYVTNKILKQKKL